MSGVDRELLLHRSDVTLARMVEPAHRVRYERSEYLALEASSNVKHEFLDGQIYGIAGGTPEHAALAAAVVGLLFPQLRQGRCRVHDADLRVRVLATGLTTYPDATIVCGPRERDPEDENAVTNPTVLVEVLSRSTEEYDRGDKFEHYKRIASLRQYVLVSHRAHEVEVWTRDDTLGQIRSRVRARRRSFPVSVPDSTFANFTNPLASR